MSDVLPQASDGGDYLSFPDPERYGIAAVSAKTKARTLHITLRPKCRVFDCDFDGVSESFGAYRVEPFSKARKHFKSNPPLDGKTFRTILSERNFARKFLFFSERRIRA